MKLISSSPMAHRVAHQRLPRGTSYRPPAERLGSGLERALRLVWRNFWLVTATAVLLCAIFAAQAAAHLVEAGLAPEPSAEASAAWEARRAARPVATPAAPSPSSSPAQPSSYAPAQPRPVLTLLATHVSADPRRSFASIVEAATRAHGGYRVGDRLPGGGVIASIHYQYVEVDYAGQLDRLLFAGDAAPTPASASAPAVPVPTELTAEERALAEGIRKTEDDRYEVDRALVDQVMANPAGFIKRLRVVPAIVDGAPAGFKLYGVTPGSMPGRLGLANGDLLQAVNGFSLTSAASGLDAYVKLREATSLDLTLQRRGKPLSIKVSIR